jgi:small subunit ribosomal protein S1
MADDKKMLSMEDLLKSDKAPEIVLPEPGTIVEGSVITINKKDVLVDLGGISVGIIAGKEAVDSAGTINDLGEGDEVSAFVLEPENDEGLVVLSLRKASQKRTWNRFVEIHDNKEVIDVKVNDANKGGLLVEVDGIKGFIPVSQLAPLNYPRVNGADSAKILARLKKLVGKSISVRVINIDHATKKLILSEKAAFADKRHTALEKLKVGDVVKGTISGVVNFGIFVTFNGLEGLVHISEIAWGHVDNPGNYGKLGDEIEVKIIGIEGEKISLSLKQMSEDPWNEISKDYKEGQKIKGKITRLTDYGAFVEITRDINGLIHVNEIERLKDEMPEVKIEKDEEIEATIVNIDADNHRIGLSILGVKPEDLEKDKKEGLAVLDLSNKALDALSEAGLTSLPEILALSEDALKGIKGLAPTNVKKIIAYKESQES